MHDRMSRISNEATPKDGPASQGFSAAPRRRKRDDSSFGWSRCKAFRLLIMGLRPRMAKTTERVRKAQDLGVGESYFNMIGLKCRRGSKARRADR